MTPWRRRGDDAGMTLVELTVAMVLGAIALTLMSSMFVASLRHNRTVTAKTTATADARIALEGLTRDLRVAVPLSASVPAMVLAGPRRVTFYAARGASSATTDPLPSKVDYSVDTTKHCLRRTITPATRAANGALSWPAASAVSTCLARGDINNDGSAIFTYYPRTTTATPTPAAFAFVSGQVATANLGSIAGVSIALTDSDVANPTVKGVQLQDQVALVNVIDQISRAGS